MRAEPIRVAVMTVSDAASRGEREDASGNAIRGWAEDRGYSVVEAAVLPDDRARVREALERVADGGAVDLVLTTGGTGFTARDITPEATGDVIERAAPGVAEALRFEGSRSTPMAWLGRGTAGIRGRTLLVNLPGSPSGVDDGLRVLGAFIDHAIQLVRGEDTHRHPDHG